MGSVESITALLLLLCRDLERKVGSEGFLDSKKYTHSYEVAEQKRAGTPRPKSRNEPIRLQDSVTLLLRSDQDKKEYDKRIKVIEVGDLVMDSFKNS